MSNNSVKKSLVFSNNQKALKELLHSNSIIMCESKNVVKSIDSKISQGLEKNQFRKNKDFFKKVKKNITLNNMLMNFINKYFNTEYEFILNEEWNKLNDEEKKQGNKIRYSIQWGLLWIQKQSIKGWTNEKTAPKNIIKSIRDKFMKDAYLITSQSVKGYFYSLCNQEELLKLLQKNKNLYEIITYDKPRKLFIDIDGYDKPELIIKEIQKILPDIKFNISGSIGDKDKKKNYHSYHLVADNYYFSCKADMKGFVNYLDVVKNELKIDNKILDNSVYKNCQNFKFINQSKKRCKRIQKMMNNKNPLNHIVEYINDDCKLITNEFDKYLIEELKTTKTIKKRKNVDVATQLNSGKVEKVDIEQPIINIQKDTDKQILNHIYNKKDLGYATYYNVMLWCIKVGLSYNIFYKWGCQPWGPNKEAKKIWKQNWVRAKENYKNINITRDYHIRYILEKQYGDIVNNELEQFKKSFLLDKTYDTLVETKYIDYNLLNEIQEKYIVINAGMGKGKSFSVLKVVEKGDYKNVLWITNRCSLCEDIYGRAKKLGFQKYNKKEAKDHPYNRDIVEIESLYKFRDNDYDLIVMDEIESLFLSFLNDTTHKGKRRFNRYLENYETFYNCLINSKKVFMMDAYISTRTINFIKSIQGDNLHIIRTNNNNPQNRNIHNYVDIHKKGGMGIYPWILDIIKDLKEGKKLYIYYPHKQGKGSLLKKGIIDIKQLLMISSGLSDKNFRVYMSDSEHKKDLMNVNKVWGRDEIKCILTNSSISVGVSYDNDDESKRFDRIYIAYETFITPRDIIQTSARIRNPRDKNIRFVKMLGLGETLNNFEIQPPAPFLLPNKGKVEDTIENDEDIDILYSTLEELHKSLLLEYDSKCLECLNFFFKISGFKIVKATKGNVEYREKYRQIVGECKEKDEYNFNLWEYDNIENIGVLKLEELEKKQIEGTIKIDEVLQIRKYYHDINFDEEVDNKIKKSYWESPKIIEGFKELLNKNSLLKYVVKFNYFSAIQDISNNISYDSLDNPKFFQLIKTPLQQWQKNIIFKKIYINKTDSDNIIRKKILNFYFGEKALYRSKKNTHLTECGIFNKLLNFIKVCNPKLIRRKNFVIKKLKSKLRYLRKKKEQQYNFIDSDDEDTENLISQF